MENIPPPSVIDIVALIIVALGMFQGFRRGLSGELARLISIVVAFALGLHFYHPFGLWLSAHTRLSEQPAHALAFITAIIAAIVTMILLRIVLKRVMTIVFEKKIDKMGGLLAGFVCSSVIVIIIFMIMIIVPNNYLNRQFGQNSVIGSVIIKYMPVLCKESEELPIAEKIETTRKKKAREKTRTGTDVKRSRESERRHRGT